MSGISLGPPQKRPLPYSAVAGAAVGVIKDQVVQIFQYSMYPFHHGFSFLQKNYLTVYAVGREKCADFCLTIYFFSSKIAWL